MRAISPIGAAASLLPDPEHFYLKSFLEILPFCPALSGRKRFSVCFCFKLENNKENHGWVEVYITGCPGFESYLFIYVHKLTPSKSTSGFDIVR